VKSLAERERERERGGEKVGWVSQEGRRGEGAATCSCQQGGRGGKEGDSSRKSICVWICFVVFSRNFCGCRCRHGQQLFWNY